jgi:hypothetical protein
MAESKEYVKLWLSYEDYFREYDDESIGAIVRAMLAYRKNGEQPQFEGPERFIWPAIQRDIDESIKAQEAASNVYRENGKKGGRPPKTSGFLETKENQKNQSGFLETKKSQGQGQGQGQGQSVISRAKRFTPPTLAEVQSYVAERQSPVDPQGFIDFYESKGWLVGKTPMKDWKAACRNAEKWERWANKAPQTRPGGDVFAEMLEEEKNRGKS